jgi:hypothetical protein
MPLAFLEVDGLGEAAWRVSFAILSDFSRLMGPPT